jgi:hypothetical protein
MRDAAWKRTAATFIAVLTVISSTGCIFSKQSGSGSLQSGFRVPATATIVLSHIPDGAGADGVMAGSGELVKTSLGTELLKRGFRVLNSGGGELQELIAEAKSKDASFVLVARITAWEDNATSWSMKRDEAGITLQLYDAVTGELRGSAERSAHGVRHPNQCAPWLAQTGVASLLGEMVPDTGPPC